VPLVVIGVVAFFYFFVFKTGSQLQSTSHLARTGTPAEARIVSFQDTGDRYNYDHIYQATVEVHLPGSPPYRAQIRQTLTDVGDLQPGAIVTVRVDPKNHSRVAFQ
jgi:hypothetical protein